MEIISAKLRTFLQKSVNFDFYEVKNPFFIILYSKEIDKLKAEIRAFAPIFAMKIYEDKILLDTTGTGVYDMREGKNHDKQREVKKKIEKVKVFKTIDLTKTAKKSKEGK